LIADGLAVFLGGRIERYISIQLVNRLASGLFILLGIITLASLFWMGTAPAPS